MMIEALFSQPNYLAAKKALDASVLRQEAIAGNIANLETPGYRRRDLAPSFTTELRQATASRDAAGLAALRPQLSVDRGAIALSPDGNTINLENEMMQLNQNSLEHTLNSQLITGNLLKLRLAITGKAS